MGRGQLAAEPPSSCLALSTPKHHRGAWCQGVEAVPALRSTVLQKTPVVAELSALLGSLPPEVKLCAEKQNAHQQHYIHPQSQVGPILSESGGESALRACCKHGGNGASCPLRGTRGLVRDVPLQTAAGFSPIPPRCDPGAKRGQGGGNELQRAGMTRGWKRSMLFPIQHAVKRMEERFPSASRAPDVKSQHSAAPRHCASLSAGWSRLLTQGRLLLQVEVGSILPLAHFHGGTCPVLQFGASPAGENPCKDSLGVPAPLGRIKHLSLQAGSLQLCNSEPWLCGFPACT